MSADIFAPTLLADVTAPKHWDTRFLFSHLSQRFDYIIQLSEAGPARWSVSVWSRAGRPSPDEIGVTGELGSLGWTPEDVTLDAACELVRQAIEALTEAEAGHVIVFWPGDWWRTQARLARSGPAQRLGGAA